MGTLRIEVPEELLQLAGFGGAEPSTSASKLMALELFREGRISLGRAAELGGIGMEEFMRFSAERRVPIHYTAEDWRDDRETAADLGL
jgi:predicted HTH domain antitoxin